MLPWKPYVNKKSSGSSSSGGNSSGGGIGLHAQGANSAAFQNGAAGIVPGAAGGGKGVDGYLIPFEGGTMLYWYGGTGGANGGGGGAGSGYLQGGMAGGSGVVILRMPTANYSGTTTGSPTVTTDGSDKVIVFNASGSITG